MSPNDGPAWDDAWFNRVFKLTAIPVFAGAVIARVAWSAVGAFWPMLLWGVVSAMLIANLGRLLVRRSGRSLRDIVRHPQEGWDD